MTTVVKTKTYEFFSEACAACKAAMLNDKRKEFNYKIVSNGSNYKVVATKRT